MPTKNLGGATAQRNQRILMYAHLEDDAEIAQRLENIFAEHPFKELPPDLLRDIASLKQGKCKRVQVIEHAMDLVHEDRDHAREETLLALDLVIEYVMAIEHETFSTEIRRPLSLLCKLSEAMFELGRGIVDPILNASILLGYAEAASGLRSAPRPAQ
jgi:hypothetical protein